MKKFIKKNMRSNILIVILMIIFNILNTSGMLIVMNFMNAIMHKNLSLVFIIIILMAVIWLFMMISQYLYSKLVSKVITSIDIDLCEALLDHLVDNSIVNFNKKNIGQYISNFNNDIIQVEQTYLQNLYRSINSGIMMITSLIAAFIFFHFSFGIFISIMLIVMYFIPMFMNKIYNKKTLELSSNSEKYNNSLKNYLTSYELFDDYNKKEIFSENMKFSIKDFFLYKRNYYNFQIKMMFFNNSLNIIAQLLGEVVVCILIFSKLMSVDRIFAAGNIQSCFFGSSLNFINYLTQAKGSKELCNKILVKNIDNTNSLMSIDKKQFNNKIEYRNINFSFDNKVIFDGTKNFVFEKNKKYAIVGGSGSGKSTLIKILLKKFDVGNDMVFIDDIDINKISKYDINLMASYVNQKPTIIDGKVKDNIIFYNENYDIDYYKYLIKLFNIEDIVDKNSLGDNGKGLSGGEIQRIALIRALLFDRDILVLDEATSAIDKRNREIIEEYLLNLDNKTILFITHHLDEKNRQYFDEIITLNK